MQYANFRASRFLVACCCGLTVTICGLIIFLNWEPNQTISRLLKSVNPGISSSQNDLERSKSQSFAKQEELQNQALLKLTDVEKSMSNRVIGQLKRDLNAIENANAQVLYHGGDAVSEETFVLILPPTLDQHSKTWDAFSNELGAADIRNDVAQKLWAEGMAIINSYAHSDLPFRVIHSSAYSRDGKRSTYFSVRDYEKLPEVRVDQGKASVFSGGAGALYSVDPQTKTADWDRYNHLFSLLPEMSHVTSPISKK